MTSAPSTDPLSRGPLTLYPTVFDCTLAGVRLGSPVFSRIVTLNSLDWPEEAGLGATGI